MSQVNLNQGAPIPAFMDEGVGINNNKSTQNVNYSQQIPSENENGKDQVNNRGFTPDTPKTGNDINVSALRDWMVATPSPGALLAALCVKEAAQQNEMNTKELFTRNESVVANINKQADKIEDAAFDQMMLSITGSLVSAAGSVGGAAITAKAPGGDALTVAKAKGDAFSGCGQSLGNIFNSIGTYVNAKGQSEVKKLDASIENSRTVMESIRNSMQAQRDLMSKSIDFMNSMQANMNQSLAKILG